MKYIGEEIYKIIPNRYPLMILDFLELKDNQAIAEIHLKEEQWFFACHYPGNPILPLSLLLESMTQTFSATFLGNNVFAIPQNEIPVISSISEMRLKESCVPGDTVKIQAILNSYRRGIAKGHIYAYKNENETPIMELDIVDVVPSQMVVIR